MPAEARRARTSPGSFIVWLAMRRKIAAWFALLALASACSGNEATSGGQATSEGTSDLASELHGPLDLPTVAPGAACPRTPGGRPNPDVGIALGSGPVYPVLGFEDNHVPPAPKGVVPLYADERKGSAYWHKTLWAVAPDYDGPVLIRGAGINPPRTIWFAYDERQLRELEFPAEESDSWRYGRAGKDRVENPASEPFPTPGFARERARARPPARPQV